MSLDGLETKADLKRCIEQQLDILRPTTPLFKNLKFGTATIAWPGGSNQSNTTTVEHGLGEEPSGVQLTPIVNEGSPGSIPHIVEKSKTLLKLKLYDPFGSPGKGITMDVEWEVKC